MTNGILLSKQKAEFWEYCKEYGVEIHPTKYPIKVDWESVERLCQKYEVPLIFYGDSGIDTERTSYQLLFDKEGKQDAFYNFIHCRYGNVGNCVQLKKGNLYTCCIASTIEHLNKKFNQNFPTDHNGINIYKATSFAEITQFLSQPIPLCQYCKMNECRRIGKWKISNKTLEEYTQKYEE